MYEEKQKNTVEDDIEEFIFMGLRMNEGINTKEFEERFNRSIESIYGNIIEKNIKMGLLNKDIDRMFLTSRGMEFSNQVMSEFIIYR